MRLFALLCAVLVVSSPVLARPVEILPETRVREILRQMPPLWDNGLRDVVNDPDTMWYDKTTIIPGYQDSFGDLVETPTSAPIGFRPNTIQNGLIDLAVPGGSAQIFFKSGEFHFPFSRSGSASDAQNTFVVNFWRLPREGGRLLPVVHWRRDPNAFTHRFEWMFPVGTVFGEVIFITQPGGQSHVFEIRTRLRTEEGWAVDIFRPFAAASQLADEVEWRVAGSLTPSIQGLIRHLRDPGTLRTATLSGRNFGGSFPAVSGAVDELPAIDNPALWVDLLRNTPFRSVKGSAWKQSGNLKTWAASTQADFSIVPKNYDAANFEVSDAFCARCHQDAGRPFRDYYKNITAYGELWGMDETFSWHPFEADSFVFPNGKVKNFNSENRKFRQDFIDAGILESYQPSTHKPDRYKQIIRSWTNFKYP